MGLSKVFIIGLAVLSQSVFSAEVDQFSRRDEPLKDSAKIVNAKANASIIKSIKEANAKGQGCREEVLYKALRGHFANHLTGELIIDILKDPNVEKRIIGLDDSVYQDWTMWDGIGMGFTIFAKKGITMSGVMRIGDQTIGTDKLEHMFGQGFNYFTKNYLDQKGEIKAVKKGIIGEKFFLGGNKIGNGVFSYGDLGANFNGMRMWNHMLQLRDDVLGADHNIGPYIACQNDQWAQVKEIDFRNYVDDSMDEAINCSKFPTQKTADKFKARLEKMGTTCPVDQRRLDDMVVKYRQMAKWMINTDGIGKVKYTGEFKNKK